MSQKQQPDDNPIDSEKVDQDIRINELEEQAKSMGIGPSHVSEDCPPVVHEQFLRHMIEYESQPLSTHFGQLVKAGVALPAPESFDDAAVHSKLWEVIHAVAKMDAYLLNTNHMSDRQLYERLWKETLREEAAIMPPGSGWTFHIDMVGSGSDEDIDTCLRYYDSEETRQGWARDFPKMVIPPREKVPFDRDRLLPKAKEHIPEWRSEEEE